MNILEHVGYSEFWGHIIIALENKPVALYPADPILFCIKSNLIHDSWTK